MSNVAVVFPGQGSQEVGMGKDFFESTQAAKDLFQMAEEASGLPIGALCFEGPMEELTRTVNLQPAITAVDLACWNALEQGGVKPLAVAGHSLGEYPALAACGALSPLRCLELVALRGKLMDRDASANPGAMSAIMGMTPEEVTLLTEEIDGLVQPANYNTPAQTVITGSSQAVAAANKLAKEKGKKAIPLKVSGAWHSPLMADAARDMAKELAASKFAEPMCFHLPNTTAQPTKDPEVIARELQKQITSPVKWVQTVQAMLDLGVDTFIECGPKTVLAGLIKKTADGVKVLNVFDRATLDKALSQL